MRHLTNASTQGKNRSDVLIDSEVPPEYRNFTRYSTLAGLSEIMKWSGSGEEVPALGAPLEVRKFRAYIRAA